MSWIGNSGTESRVRATAIVMHPKIREDQPQVSFVDRSQKVQALSPNRAHQSFAVGVCLRSLDRGFDHAHTEVFQSGVQRARKDRVAIVNDESIWMCPCQDFPKLLCGPCGGRMRHNVAVQDSPRADFHCDKNVQYPKRRRDCHEEVAGDNRLRVIAHECGPTLIRTAARSISTQILPYGSRRDAEAQLKLQLVGDPFLAPSWVIACDLLDQFFEI